MKNILVFLLPFFVCFSELSASCEDNKIIITYVVSKQVIGVTNQLRLYNKTYLNMDKMEFDIGHGIIANSVKLYDLIDIVGRDTFTWTEPENTQQADINIGMDNMVLKIALLTYKGKEYENANVEVTNVTLNTLQTTVYKRDSCDQKYPKTRILPITKAVLENQIDVTEDFNKIIIPWINEQMASNDFQALVAKYFDSCDPRSNVRLSDLIVSPYNN